MTRAAIVLCAALAAGLAISAPTSTAAGQLTQRDWTLERAIVSELNDVREQHGLPPLATSTDLRAAAVAHTRAMATSGLFQHDSADGSPFHERVLRYYNAHGGSWSVGENLVFGSAPFGAKSAVQAWLRSPPHRRVLLGAVWRDVGVGAIVARRAHGAFGGGTVVIVTADFGRR